jgi:MFS family permease
MNNRANGEVSIRTVDSWSAASTLLSRWQRWPAGISDSRSARKEWHASWPLVLAALAGGSFAAMPVYAMAFFIDPLSHDLGWSRTQVSVGLSFIAIVGTPLAPVAGALIDRYGARRIGIWGLAATAVAFASMGLTTGSLALWMAQWALYALVAVTLKNTIWTAAVSSAFNNGRGMAIAVTLCGTALGQTFAPLLAYWLINAAGWRFAYVGLAAGWGGLVLLLLILFFHDARHRELKSAAAGNPAPSTLVSMGGLSIREALRSLQVYRIAAAMVIGSIMAVAVVTHKVSILNEMGISRGVAAQIAATAGVAGIAGKLITGWLYDRSGSQWIGMFAYGIPALGFVLLLEPVRTSALIVVAMILLGLGSGASLQATVYLVARYAGLRNFGKIFGTMGSITALSIGVGPLLGGVVFDSFHTYSPLIVAGIPLGVLAGLLVGGLGPYPNWAMPEKA